MSLHRLASLLAVSLAFCSAAAVAAVDINQADQATLEAVKGIGPAMSARMLDERKKSPFKDWPDLIDRVKGVGAGNAARFSEAGLTVNGAAYGGGNATARAPAAGRGAKAEQPAKADKAGETQTARK